MKSLSYPILTINKWYFAERDKILLKMMTKTTKKIWGVVKHPSVSFFHDIFVLSLSFAIDQQKIIMTREWLRMYDVERCCSKCCVHKMMGKMIPNRQCNWCVGEPSKVLCGPWVGCPNQVNLDPVHLEQGQETLVWELEWNVYQSHISIGIAQWWCLHRNPCPWAQQWGAL